MASNHVLLWSSMTRRRAGPTPVPVTGVRHQARIEDIIFGRSEATIEPGRRTWRKNAAGRRSACGATGRKLWFDADCFAFLHGCIEHPRVAARFTKLRIGDLRRWRNRPPTRKAPPARAGLRGTSVEVFPVPITDTIPALLCPSPCGHHESPRRDKRRSRTTSFAASLRPSPYGRLTDALASRLPVGIVVVDRIEAK